MPSDRPKTIEYFQRLFMNEGFDSMVTAIKELMNEAGNPVTSKRVNMFIQAVLYGYNSDGTARVRPPQPDMFLLGKGRVGQDLYNFQSRVWSLYVKQRNKN
jgi:hypothetical protein